MKSMHSGCKWVVPIKSTRNIQICLFLSVCLPACSSAQSVNTSEWTSKLHAEHALVGKIWSSSDNRFIEQEQLLDAVARSKYLLLGEKHDNPDHHHLQGLILQDLLPKNLVGSIAFEMLTSESQEKLDAIQEQRFTTLEQLKTYLQWDEAGWDWAFYGPLVKDGYDARVALLAANIDDSKMMEVYGGELNPEISEVLPPAVMDRLNLDIDESHCGLLPESQFPAMVRVQQSRDHQMAVALGNKAEAIAAGSMQVLIAGNYHVRKDLGVPNYLLSLQPNLGAADIVVISFSEVDPASVDPADYLQRFSETNAYDYIWFTPAISDEDYCASLQQEQ